MSTRTVDNPKVVSRDEWLVARKKLLAKEKQLTRERDAIAAERRQLPWVKVEKNYVFDSPSGKKTLADLFDGKSQLIVYHFMFGPEWKEGCPSCSFNMDHTDGALVHLAQRDVSFAAVSRAPLSKIEAFKKRMGWKFNWVSSYGTDFNYDYHVSFTPEQLAKGKVEYNFDLVAVSQRGSAWNQRLLQRQRRQHLPHLFRLRSRDREHDEHVQLSRPMFPKAAMKMACPSRCPGSAITIATRDGRLADADRPYWPAEPLSLMPSLTELWPVVPM